MSEKVAVGRFAPRLGGYWTAMLMPVEPSSALDSGRRPSAARSAERERLELRIRRLQALARGLRADAKSRRPGAARAYRSHAAELEAQVLHLQELVTSRSSGSIDIGLG
jgi:hypothetical protein